MSVPKDDSVYLWDMLTAARAVMAFTRGRTLAEYEADLLLRSAVERQIEIIGEAARRVSKDFQEAHPEIQWRPIQAQRHVLAHDYGEIKHDRIWRVAETHVPELIVLLEPLVPAPPAEGQESAE
jgi:uncharacterized protein with HEPN domain